MARIKYFQKTESVLYDYKLTKLGIKNMKSKLEILTMYDGIGSVDPGAESFKTNKISSVTENAALRNIEKSESLEVRDLKEKIQASEELIERIDEVIKELKENQQEIVRLYYFEGVKNDRKVSDKMAYTELWCGCLRRAAVEKISVGLGYSIPKEARITKKESYLQA